MKMARIAGLDYVQTTNMMTAALRGFNMELNETSAQRVNDVYSKLAAITASDTRELGLAMERTASIAHSAGMDFGNTTAFLAQMIETTREAPENLGTAMKTIIARFQELKVDPNSLIDSEGEALDFNRVDKALKTIGVSLVDTQGQFRDLDDVFL
jgi:TP901 family phage tail tape measure protein